MMRKFLIISITGISIPLCAMDKIEHDKIHDAERKASVITKKHFVLREEQEHLYGGMRPDVICTYQKDQATYSFYEVVPSFKKYLVSAGMLGGTSLLSFYFCARAFFDPHYRDTNAYILANFGGGVASASILRRMTYDQFKRSTYMDPKLAKRIMKRVGTRPNQCFQKCSSLRLLKTVDAAKFMQAYEESNSGQSALVVFAEEIHVSAFRSALPLDC